MPKKYAADNSEKYVPHWQGMLNAAIHEPGKMMAAYRAFHNYSLNNQLLAMFQCHERGIEIGPIKAGKAWNTVGRSIKKGEKGIYMCYPKHGKRTDKATGDDVSFTYFGYAKYWFVYSQTEGDEYNEEPLKSVWDLDLALKTLKIESVPFTMLVGNTQGFAQYPNKIAINPMAQIPAKTRFHEMAHLILGHVDDLHNHRFIDGDEIDKSEIEMEAEGVAMLCLDALGLDGVEYCRGYMQNWSKGKEISDTMSHRIITAADQILRAGYPPKTKGAPSE